MQLHTAIQRAAKFVARGKGAPEALQKIRFFPRGDNTPSYVHATDGEVGVIIPVDVPCPDMALDASILVGVAKEAIESVYVDDGGTRTVIFKSKGVAGYAVGLESSQGHPMFPDYPTQMKDVEHWPLVLKAAHAVLPKGETVDGGPRPDLECVHFCGTRVEATDSYRMVVVDVDTDFSGLLPGGGFKHWPKGPVTAAVTEAHAWFSVGDELRYVRRYKGQYANGLDLRDTHVPEYHDGPWLTLDTKDFRDIAKRAASMNDLKRVILEVGFDGVTLKSQTDDQFFEEKVRGDIGLAVMAKCEFPKMLLNWKFLDAALKVVDTPNVRLCYGGAASPVRLESGGYVECLWPTPI